MSAIANLPGYQITEQLYTGTRTLVYRAIRTSDQYPVVIKLLRNEYPNFNELVGFRNQYTIAKNLDFFTIIKPVSLEAYHNSYALVMEDFGGISLSTYLKTAATDEKQLSNSLSLKEFLNLALQLADILDYLYQNRVIHKDIKPANILINPKTKQVKLIDFSISSLLPRETQEIQNPNVLEGTLAYLSPEQTGRMNRGIDYRSDLYSLGVTFYELLTKQLPFVSDDPMELVHCHLAKQPMPLHQINPEISLVLSQIVDKLMAKNAENRYQSALGLKHDLEICLVQLQETGTIGDFELGKRDITDRFLIPEKLYGRETEVKTLLQAFERVSLGATEMMLVAGFSGIGKTAVVNEVHKPIVRQRGYFIKGKYDQFQRNIPFSAFVQAFRDLMGQLLSESDRQLNIWKNKILEAVGNNGQVLIDVIPELELIIGEQPAVTELSGSSAQNRFNLLMQNFIKVFSSQEHLLVMFIDDLQWSDSASQSLLKLLIQDTKYLLVLGAYRDNEVSPVHPFILTVDEIVKTGAVVNTIALQPLNLEDTNQLIADTLNCELPICQPLTTLVYQKTQGNPFFATQFFKALHDDRLITFDWETWHWQCDIAQVIALALTDDVVEFMALQLQKLPTETQDMLKLAACIGAEFDLHTLIIVSGQSAEITATALWKALQEGLVIPTTKIYKFFTQSTSQEVFKITANPTYRFLHDRIQQAAYSLIMKEQKQETHLKIGRLLWRHTSQAEQSERIFEIVNHFNQGLRLIINPAERIDLAQLNLLAGQKAKASTAYETALNYLLIGLSLMPEQSWQIHFDLMRIFYEEAAEAAFLTRQFEQMKHLINTALGNIEDILDTVKIQEIRIVATIAENQLNKAVDIGLSFLKQLNIELPVNPQASDVDIELERTQVNLSDRLIQGLIYLPLMTNKSQLAAMQIISGIITAAYKTNPNLFSLIVLRQVNLSVKYGNTAASAIAYSMYGLILCLSLNDVESGYQFGQLALDLCRTIDVKKIEAKAVLLVNIFTAHRKQHIRETLQPLIWGYNQALEVGDVEYVAYCGYAYCLHSYLAGEMLETVEQKMRFYQEIIENLKQEQALSLHTSYRQAVLNLMGQAESTCRLVGEAYDEDQEITQNLENNYLEAFFYAYLNKLMLCYLFGDYTQAIQAANSAAPYLAGGIPVILFYFYDSLVRFALCDTAKEEQANHLKKIAENQQKMHLWMLHAPMNYQHKYDLVAGEQHRVLGNKSEAMDLYDRAISGAKENEYIQEEALANELAAKFYLDWGKEKVAAGYMQEAYYCYARWGAKAKVIDLETRYPQLLKPILQQPKTNFNPLETLTSITHSSTQGSTSNISETLDFASVIKAAQALSSTIQLDELLKQLTQIILQNSGGDKCILVLPQDEIWQVRAISTPEITELCSEPLDNHPNAPTKLIQYVKRMQSAIAIDNLQTDLPVIDDYLIQRQPKSVLCLPILDRGHLAGILYLKNQSTAGIFTSDRLTVIEFLCTQAAISLENARLYQQSQAYAQQLQQSQLRIIQSEKMSALGNLVAGVAHEINNPVGFVSGNLQEAQKTVQDLVEHLNLYRSRAPETDIADHAEDIDLDYLLEDLPKMIDSMKVGCDRIKGISTSLRTFSRADTDHPVACNIHDGIDSTIMILKHRLKANEKRPEIAVIKDYGDLPPIECYAGQLNQVFMNLLANAIDALDESNKGRDYEYIANQITIKTEFDGNKKQAIIRIQDNGLGMSEQVQSKIFDELFTTKDVGKGTGLGLAIARQIIVEKHGGAIEVNSVLREGTEFAIALPVCSLN